MSKTRTYLLNSLRACFGIIVYRRILKSFAKGPETNRDLLIKILRDNKDTDYGKKYSFARIRNITEYQEAVPVVTYDDVSPYIERMAAGEKNVLTAYTVKHMNSTSGTSGAPKKIPMSEKQKKVFFRYDGKYLDGLRTEQLGYAWKRGKNFSTSEGTYTTLPSGITYGSASSVMADMVRGFDVKALSDIVNVMFTSPPEASIPEEGTDTKYIQIRFALMEKNTSGIITGYNSQVHSLFKFVDNNYPALIQDIEQGTISENVAISQKAREALEKRLRPMPERAAELREIFKNGPDLRWAPLVWPNLVFIQGVGGDGFSVYTRIIKEKYTGESVRFIYSGIIASEGIWSVPSGINTEDSVMTPESAFFEFLPVECGDDFSKCVTMDQMEVGKTYELIITNLSGLYRYRTNDAVQVTDFQGKTPTVRFMYRVNQVISMVAEKTTTTALQNTVQNAMDELGVAWNDYTVYPDYENLTYVFLVEPAVQDVGVSTERLAECLTRHLRRQNPLFALQMDHGYLKKPAAHWMQPETMLLYRDLQIHQGAQASQLKPLRVIKTEKQRQFFFGLLLNE